VPNSSCINDDALWPHAGPSRFIAVGSTDTVAAGQLGFGLVTSYLSRPVPLQVPAPGQPGSSQYVINDQANGTFLWSYGATDHLELDFALPLTFGQGGAGLQPLTGGPSLHDTAARDLRFGVAYALVPHLRVDPDPGITAAPAPGEPATPTASNAFGLVARFEMSAPSGDRSQFASDRTAVYVPSLAADLREGPLFFGLEFGARLRPVTELAGARVGTELVAMAGAGWDILPHELLSATLEAWMLPTLVGQGAGAGDPLIPSEWQLAARTSPLRGGDIAVQFGGGTAIPFGGESEISRPRMRFTLSVRWAPAGRRVDPVLPPVPPAPAEVP
jgi:hypothetical protein